ncbi:MAG: TonB-dependent receptor, partial [Bacteroidia bacterium]|nr:TonB-dependent receptor [Bacteroidia bacterium]
MKKGTWALIGSICLWAQSLQVQDEEGKPVARAQVRLQNVSTGARLLFYTDSLGGIAAPPGIYRIEISAEGFLSIQEERELPSSTPFVLTRPVYQLSENIITGQYAPVTELRSLYPVRILTAERLQAQGALYLPQALMTELNTRMAQDPNLGTFATLQGLGGEHVKVLIDGVPVIGRVSGSIDLAQLPLSEVDRVEIVEGPMSVLYGTDAMGGVINLITRTSRCQWETRGRFQFEGIGVYDAGFSVAGGPAKHRVSLAGGRYYFDGWDPNPQRPRAQLWRPREQYNALLSYQFRPSDHLRIRLQLPFSNEVFFNLKEPTITPYRIYSLDEYYYTRRIMPALDMTYTLSKKLRWDQQVALLSYRRIRNVVYKDLVTLTETLVPLEGQQDSTQEHNIWARGGLSYTGENSSYQIGHELQHTLLTGGRIQGGRAEMGDYALWGTGEWNLLPTLALRPGFRWAYNTRYRAPFLPALHLRWTPLSSLTWRIGYSRGFRAPSLREQFLYLVFTNHNIQG